MKLYRMVALEDGETNEPVQYVGVYVLSWGEVYEPTVAFVEVGKEEAEKILKEMVDAQD